MKQLLYVLLLLPTLALAQAKNAYEHTMTRFTTFYNNGQADSIRDMFSDEWGAAKAKLWTAAKNAELRDQYGKITSWTYLGMPPDDDVQVFKVVCEKSTHAASMTLDNNKQKIGTFRFRTTSDEIEKMLK